MKQSIGVQKSAWPAVGLKKFEDSKVTSAF
jgi:hypothetical protein